MKILEQLEEKKFCLTPGQRIEVYKKWQQEHPGIESDCEFSFMCAMLEAEHTATIEAMKKDGWKSPEECAICLQCFHKSRDFNKAVQQARRETAREFLTEIEKGKSILSVGTNKGKFAQYYLRSDVVEKWKAKYLIPAPPEQDEEVKP